MFVGVGGVGLFFFFPNLDIFANILKLVKELSTLVKQNENKIPFPLVFKHLSSSY